MKVGLYGALNESPTGPSKVTVGIAHGLAEAGIDVDIVTNGERTDHPHPSVSVVNVPGSPSSVRGFVQSRRAVSAYVDGQSYDLFHSLIGIMRGADVLTCQGIFADLDHLRWSPSVVGPPREFLGANVYSVLKSFGIYRTRTVVATSPLVDRQLGTYLRTSADATVPLGVYADDRVEPSGVSDPVRVLVPGRIEPRKGQAWFLEHLDPDTGAYHIDIVGGVSDERYYEQFQADWEDHVHGFVSRGRLNELYREADIVVVPSRQENFGITAVEAIASGCTLVITDNCGFATYDEAIPDNGVFVVDNGEEAADRMRSLAAEDDLSNYKQSAYDLSERFTWDRIGEEYVDIYDQLCE